MTNETETFIRMDRLLEILPVSTTTIFKWVKSGQFPAPIRIGPNVSAWSSVEIEAWKEARKAKRGAVGDDTQEVGE